MTIGTPDTGKMNCDGRNTYASTCSAPNASVDVPQADYCCIGTTAYCNEGCDLSNSNSWLITCISVSFVTLAAIIYIHKRVVTYPANLDGHGDPDEKSIHGSAGLG